MDEYAAYVWTAYAVTGVVVLAMLLLSWRYRRRWIKAAEALEQPRRRQAAAATDQANS